MSRLLFLGGLGSGGGVLVGEGGLFRSGSLLCGGLSLLKLKVDLMSSLESAVGLSEEFLGLILVDSCLLVLRSESLLGGIIHFSFNFVLDLGPLLSLSLDEPISSGSESLVLLLFDFFSVNLGARVNLLLELFSDLPLISKDSLVLLEELFVSHELNFGRLEALFQSLNQLGVLLDSLLELRVLLVHKGFQLSVRQVSRSLSLGHFSVLEGIDLLETLDLHSLGELRIVELSGVHKQCDSSRCRELELHYNNYN